MYIKIIRIYLILMNFLVVYKRMHSELIIGSLQNTKLYGRSLC